VNKLVGLVILGLAAGWGVSRFMKFRGYGVEEKMKAKAEQFKGRVEQAVGKATGSEKTQARGVVDEASGKARERVADTAGEVKKVEDEARDKIGEIKAFARAAIEKASA